MYSFRLNEDLIDKAKIVANKMDVSLSLFISYAVREKLDSLKGEEDSIQFFVAGKKSNDSLKAIVEEIKKIRLVLNKIFKK